MPFAATWMNLEIIKLSESAKDKYHMVSFVCEILKMTQMNLFAKQEQTHRLRKQANGYQRGKMPAE